MSNIDVVDEIMKSIDCFINNDNHNFIKEEIFKVLSTKEIRDLDDYKPKSNSECLQLFLASKKIEGCSQKSLNYYRIILENILKKIGKIYYLIQTEDLRIYLSNYQDNNNVSKATIDNVRRIASSFFSWLESEDYIVKSPARRIHKVRVGKVVKEIYSDETMELIRQNSGNIRNLAIIDLLSSTGIRVGELVNLNIDDMDFENKECVVLGKGSKQRKVYYDAKTKLHLLQYLEKRNDFNPALFVELIEPHNRLQISGVEIALRKIGKKIGLEKVHPHKFRRTLATKAIDKGMPIEQVQHLLGHTKIDTTLEYAIVDDGNVKISHKKFLE